MWAVPAASTVKSPPADAGDAASISGLPTSPWRRNWQPTPVFLPGKSRGQWSLARLQSTGVMKNRDTTELAGYTLGHFHSSLPCICEIKFSCAFSPGSSVSHPSHS